MSHWHEAEHRLIESVATLEPELRRRILTAVADLLEPLVAGLRTPIGERRPDTAAVPAKEEVQTVVNRLREPVQPASSSNSEEKTS